MSEREQLLCLELKQFLTPSSSEDRTVKMRNAEENMMKKIVALQTHLKLVEYALKSAKTGLRKLQEMKDKLENLYFSLVESHHFYKADVISKECKTEEAFNGKQDVDRENYHHNDSWADAQMAKFVDGTENIEDKMKEQFHS